MDQILVSLGFKQGKVRADKDLYTTDPVAIHKLLNAEKFSSHVYEPCAGLGHISNVLKEYGYNVTSADIVQRSFPLDKVEDFLQRTELIKGDVITNPPYVYALEFVQKALSLVADNARVAMLLRIQFLEGIARGEFFKTYPPKTVYVFSRRVQCLRNGERQERGSAMCFCWFIWQKGYKGEPSIKWL